MKLLSWLITTLALAAMPCLGQEPAALVDTAPKTRRDKLVNNMHIVQTVLEAWAVDHYGEYPGPDVPWTPDSGIGMLEYFPGGDPFGPDGNHPVEGRLPRNPFTDSTYVYEHDLFYLPDKFLEPGIYDIASAADPDCPYVGLAAPENTPGTIVVLGYTDEDEGVLEYAIAGYDSLVSEPIFEMRSLSHGAPATKTFFLLHN